MAGSVCGWLTLAALVGSGLAGGCGSDGSTTLGGEQAGIDGGIVLTDGGGGTPGGPDASAGLTCDPVTAVAGMTLHVNPLAGDDVAGTGSGTKGGVATSSCAYRSLTRAVAVAAAAAQPRTTVMLDVTATASAATGEVFPVLVPADTAITAATGVTATAQVATGDGFHLIGAGAALRSLVLIGGGVAERGVVVTAGTAVAPTVIAGVELTGFTVAGIEADSGAVLTITAATNAHDNGTASPAGGAPGPAGLLALGTAVVSVDGVGATEQHPTRFATNSGYGIDVRGQGRVNVAGTLSPLTPGAGTVVVAGNTLAGVHVEQLLVAQGQSGPAGMTMIGLVATLNGTHGLHLFGGSGVKVRGSYLSKNAGHGVYVQTDPAFIGGGSGANDGNEIVRLDFGVTGDPGHNVLSDVANLNGLKGVCLEITSGNGLGGLLKLQGDVFATGGSTVDCSQIAGALPATGECAAQGPLGDVGRNPKVDLDVASCTVP